MSASRVWKSRIVKGLLTDEKRFVEIWCNATALYISQKEGSGLWAVIHPKKEHPIFTNTLEACLAFCNTQLDLWEPQER